MSEFLSFFLSVLASVVAYCKKYYTYKTITYQYVCSEIIHIFFKNPYTYFMTKTIAENMVEIMKQHNRTNIWYGDIDLIEECAKKSHIPPKHPQQTIQHILNALDKSQYFSKGYIYSDISGKNRKYRCFKIKA